MKKTSLARALIVAGMMAVAGGMAQADAIFYPDGSRVELGAKGVESGLADAVLAQSPWSAPDASRLASLGVTADQSAPILASSDEFDGTVLASGDTIDTSMLGAGPATRTVTTVTTVPVYVFPSIDFDRHTVFSQPHPMMSRLSGSREMDRSAAATFNSPTRAGEASTMTSGAPNLVTDNASVAGTRSDTSVLGAGSNSMRVCDSGATGCSWLND